MVACRGSSEVGQMCPSASGIRYPKTCESCSLFIQVCRLPESRALREGIFAR